MYTRAKNLRERQVKGKKRARQDPPWKYIEIPEDFVSLSLFSYLDFSRVPSENIDSRQAPAFGPRRVPDSSTSTASD